MHLLCEGLAEDNTIPTKPPLCKQQSPTQEKQDTINQRALSETMLPLKQKRRKEWTENSYHFTHLTQSPINSNLQKEKNGTKEKIQI